MDKNTIHGKSKFDKQGKMFYNKRSEITKEAKMNNFVKMDVAIELLADKISKTTKQYITTNNLEYQNQLNHLMMERDNIYNGDIATIDKVINTYGEELKKYNLNEEL